MFGFEWRRAARQPSTFYRFVSLGYFSESINSTEHQRASSECGLSQAGFYRMREAERLAGRNFSYQHEPPEIRSDARVICSSRDAQAPLYALVAGENSLEVCLPPPLP